MLIPAAKYDQAVDYWALGVLLFELSFGFTPFFDFSEVKLARKIRRGFREDYFPQDRAYAEDLKDLVGAMLRKVPAERLPMRGVHLLEEGDFFSRLRLACSEGAAPGAAIQAPALSAWGLSCFKISATYRPHGLASFLCDLSNFESSGGHCNLLASFVLLAFSRQFEA